MRNRARQADESSRHGLRRLARKIRFVEPDQRDLGRPVPSIKISRLSRRANHLYKLAPSRSNRGALAIVTDVERDAVDADGAPDESTRCGRRSRVVLMSSSIFDCPKAIKTR